MKERRSAYATAQLILINAKLYESEREKEITRYRFSIHTLRRISRRNSIRATFIAQLDEELAELGWFLIPLGTEFGVMDISKMENWVKLSSKRLIEAGYTVLEEKNVSENFFELFPNVTDEKVAED
jgi:hypothetical protein